MYAVAIGPLSSSCAETLTTAAARAGVDIDVYGTLPEAKRALSGSGAPSCVLAGSDAPIAAIAEWIRGRDGWFNLPLFALVAHPSESLFASAYAAGADDAVVAHDVTGILRRLTNLQHHNPALRPAASAGLALVASADIGERRSFGRLLRQAGFEVSFASDAQDLVAASSGAEAPTLLVTTPSFPPMGGDAAVDTVRIAAGNPRLPAIVVERPEPGTGGRHGALQTRGDVKGQLLFFAEEALRGQPTLDQRASRRLHFATICAFRVAGLMEPSYGLSHNVSREGLFIRTLDPAPAGHVVWLELRTFDEATVHLRGKVVWRREAGQVGGTTPPGFGVRLDEHESPADDLTRYVASYDNLLRHQGRVN